MHDQELLISLTLVAVLGIGAQWLAWRLRLPSILLLLIFGLAAGPLSGFLWDHRLIDPNKMLGEFLFPVVSASVAIILFEGGMSLKLDELREIGGVVRNLITIGAFVTWTLTAVAAHYTMDLNWSLSLVLGAILVVTGPTVVIPLLRHVRPNARLSSIAKWEGIMIDPVGAVLAVLVYEVALSGGFSSAAPQAAFSIAKTIVVGVVVGLLATGLMIWVLRRYWAPDFLQNPIFLMVVLAAFAISNVMQPESGLLTVTIMGIVLANQRTVAVRHVVEFKENLRTLLLAGLFIMLAARVEMSDITSVSWRSILFLAVMMLVVRPAAVFASCFRSGLSFKEQLFLSWLAPRGIVAASIASVFALRLADSEAIPQAAALVPVIFVVILGTVAIYGLTAKPLANFLNLAEPEAQGVLFAGAQPWVRAIALALKEENVRVLLVDTNRDNIAVARLEGIPTYYGSILAERSLETLNLQGLGRLLAITPNDEVNSLATLRFAEVFGRGEVYQLPPQSSSPGRKQEVSHHLRGRLLFGRELTHSNVEDLFGAGAVVKRTRLTKEFDLDAFRRRYGNGAVSLFVLDERGQLIVNTVDNPLKPKVGQMLISIVDPRDANADGESHAAEISAG